MHISEYRYVHYLIHEMLQYTYTYIGMYIHKTRSLLILLFSSAIKNNYKIIYGFITFLQTN